MHKKTMIQGQQYTTKHILATMCYERIALEAPVAIETRLACMTIFVISLTGKTCYLQKKNLFHNKLKISNVSELYSKRI
jgi:hypothetical protein